MKEREATPAEQAANWWQSDEGVEGLEQALDDGSLVSEQSIVEAFLSPASHQPAVSWQRTLLLVIGFMGMLLLVGVGFIGLGVWRLAATPAGAATPSSQVNLNSLLQIRGEMDMLDTRLAAVETVQPTIVAALTTIQAQVADLQRTPTPITTVPPIPSLTPISSPTPSPSLTPTPSPTPSPSLIPTSSPTPSPSLTPTPSPTPSPSLTPTPSPAPFPSPTSTP
jgi:hypothetical protein